MRHPGAGWNMDMNCEQTREHLVEYLYGELPEELASEVEAELDQCPECAAQLAQMRRVHDLVDALPRLEVPGPVHHNILRQARLAAAAQQKTTRRSVFGFIGSPAFATAVVVCLVLGVGVLLERRGADVSDQEVAVQAPPAAVPGAQDQTVAAAPEQPAMARSERALAEEIRSNAALPMGAQTPAGGEVQSGEGEVAQTEAPQDDFGSVAQATPPAAPTLQPPPESSTAVPTVPELAAGAAESSVGRRPEAEPDVVARLDEAPQNTDLPRSERARVYRAENEDEEISGRGGTVDETVGGTRTGEEADRRARDRVAEAEPTTAERERTRRSEAQPAEPADGLMEGVATADEPEEPSADTGLEWRSSATPPQTGAIVAPEDVVADLEMEAAERGYSAGQLLEQQRAEEALRDQQELFDEQRQQAQVSQAQEEDSGDDESDEPSPGPLAAESSSVGDGGGRLEETLSGEAEEGELDVLAYGEDTREAASADPSGDWAREAQGMGRGAGSVESGAGGSGAGPDIATAPAAQPGLAREAEVEAEPVPAEPLPVAATPEQPETPMEEMDLNQLYVEGLNRYNDGSYRDAVAYFDAFIQNAPRSNDLLALSNYYQGQANMQLGAFGAAADNFEQVADPSFEHYIEARLLLAQSYEYSGQLDAAAGLYAELRNAADDSVVEAADEGMERIERRRREDAGNANPMRSRDRSDEPALDAAEPMPAESAE